MNYDATQTLRTITVPTLVVAGDRDTTTLPSASERMRAEIPAAQQVTLSPAKHLGLIEHHEKYAQAIEDFVRPVLKESALSGVAA